MEQEIDEYIEYIGRNRGKSDNTIASYKSDLYKLMNYLKAFIETTCLATVDGAHPWLCRYKI